MKKLTLNGSLQIISDFKVKSEEEHLKTSIEAHDLGQKVVKKRN